MESGHRVNRVGLGDEGGGGGFGRVGGDTLSELGFRQISDPPLGRSV